MFTIKNPPVAVHAYVHPLLIHAVQIGAIQLRR